VEFRGSSESLSGRASTLIGLGASLLPLANRWAPGSSHDRTPERTEVDSRVLS
jgi:hypothetical protein